MSEKPFVRGIAALAILVAACGPKGTGPVDTPPIDENGNSADDDAPEFALPEVPAEVDTQRIEPTSDHDPSARSPLLGYMAEENQRWMQELEKQQAPAYYLAYEIHDIRRVVIEAEGGALIADEDEIDRYVDVVVRVGSPELDNMRPLSNDREAAINEPLTRHAYAPFGTDELAIKNALWLETDRRYREATIAYRRVLQDHAQLSAKDKNKAPDFVHEEPETYIQEPATLSFDKEAWVRRVRSCSERAYKGVATRGTCRADFALDTVYFVNSEGTELQMSWPSARLSISVGVKADDGMQLSRLEQAFARTPSELPGDPEIDEMITKVTDDLEALHEAPVVDPYDGPAILEGRAAGVFFHEVFGHRMEGHRQKQWTSGQTFATKVGKRIMPAWLTIYDDPTLTRLNKTWLNGFYRFDDEGVRAQKALLVEGGVLKGFIQGRQPIVGHPTSNGHGRKAPGRQTVSRQGNLVVEASRSVPREQLMEMLIAEIERQGKPYGMLFTDISGGFTNTSRFLPQAFKVEPVMAYRVYPDGRKQLVRGVDISGTPLIALGSIVAASREVETFNGICGAESGWVPVSASAPSLMLRQIEVERSLDVPDRPPVLNPPSVRDDSLGGAR